jgi:hypothetical protein
MAVTGQVAVTQIVGKDDDEVRLAGGLLRLQRSKLTSTTRQRQPRRPYSNPPDKFPSRHLAFHICPFHHIRLIISIIGHPVHARLDMPDPRQEHAYAGVSMAPA